MSDYRHILWDWNGTLLNDVWLCVEVMNRMLARRSLTCIDSRTYRAIFDFPVRIYYERAWFDFSEETFESVATEFWDEYSGRVCECSLQEGAERLLEDCAAAGLRQSILSATEQNSLETTLSTFGIMSLFDRVVGQSDHYAVGKAELAKQLVAALDTPGEKVLLIGDTTHDLHVATTSGIHCLLVAAGHHAQEKLERTGARVVPALSEVRTLLRTMDGRELMDSLDDDADGAL